MRKYLFFLMVILFVSVIFTSCENFTPIPAPEVTVLYFSPLGVYTCPGDTIPVGMEEIQFKVWNYVDARLTNMSYVYRSVPGDSIITPTYNMGLDVLLSGGDETCVTSCITTVYNLWLEVDSALDYMDSLKCNSVAEITFTGEDDFDKGKEFECKIYFSLNLVP
ncbi:hypothetical protein KAX75_06950 [candidate division WOR-3 bacterium]|nr:hypothetical protein [candidate division WOR-3 bacterium]